MAVGEGFEPPRPVRVYPRSKRAHSARLCQPTIINTQTANLLGSIHSPFSALGQNKTPEPEWRGGKKKPGAFSGPGPNLVDIEAA